MTATQTITTETDPMNAIAGDPELDRLYTISPGRISPHCGPSSTT